MTDPDLIAALAEGSLSGEDERRARTLIASDPAARREYEMQRIALRALQTMDTPRLNELERRRLRTALQAVRPQPAQSKTIRRRWPRVAFAAALVLVAAVAAPLLSSLSRNGGNRTALPEITVATDKDESAVVDEPQVTAPTATLPPMPTAGGTNRQPAPTLETTLTDPPTGETTTPLQYLGEFTQESLSLALADYADNLATAVDDGVQPVFGSAPDQDLHGDTITVEPVKCRIGDVFPDSTVEPVGTARLDGAPVTIYRVDSGDSSESQLVTVDRDSCEIVDV